MAEEIKTNEAVAEEAAPKKAVRKPAARKAEGEAAEKKAAPKKTAKKAEGEAAEKEAAPKKTAKKAEGEAAEKKAAPKKTAAKKAETPVEEVKPETKPVKKAEAMLTIRLTRGFSHRLDNQIATAKSMGLRKVGDVAHQPDNAATQGKINVIRHMVEVTKE